MNRHSIANYPQSIKGTVVSPTKICIQYGDVQCKLRVNDGVAGLMKMPDGILAMPIRTDGAFESFQQGDPKKWITVDTLAVGCQMPEVEELQRALISAYIHYGRNHSETYTNTYGKDFLDFLLQTKALLENAISKLEPD